jgi:lipoprotein-anchoring transpeptidase ErfK/SrfK
MIAGSASAVTVTSPRTDHLRAAPLAVNLSSADPTSTVVLMIDGRAVGVRPALPGQRLDFGTFGLPIGPHTAAALLRSRTGVIRSASLPIRIWAQPFAASLVTPAPGSYVGRYVNATVRTGLHTTAVQVYVNGRFVRTVAVRENSLQSIGSLTLDAGVNTIQLVATNPSSYTRSSFTITRLDYPWPTCIIIDKSDFKLYWVRDGVLVKTYPIAIGKAGTPTPVGIWKVGMKHITSWGSVYGPRKLRLYRKTASGFVYTAYAIHGTNQEWVIGTMASHGCIRMYNRDVLELYPQVAIGTMVQTRQ